MMTRGIDGPQRDVGPRGPSRIPDISSDTHTSGKSALLWPALTQLWGALERPRVGRAPDLPERPGSLSEQGLPGALLSELPGTL